MSVSIHAFEVKGCCFWAGNLVPKDGGNGCEAGGKRGVFLL